MWNQTSLANCRMERTPKTEEQLHLWLMSVKRRRKPPSRGSCSTSLTEDSQVDTHAAVHTSFSSLFFCFVSACFDLPVLLSRASLSVAEWGESSYRHQEDLWDLAPPPWLLAACWHHTVSFQTDNIFNTLFFSLHRCIKLLQVYKQVSWHQGDQISFHIYRL